MYILHITRAPIVIFEANRGRSIESKFSDDILNYSFKLILKGYISGYSNYIYMISNIDTLIVFL